jgi:hypothetical protein
MDNEGARCIVPTGENEGVCNTPLQGTNVITLICRGVLHTPFVMTIKKEKYKDANK